LTVVFFDGFETGDVSAWTTTATTTGTTVSVVSTAKHTGTYSFKSGNVQNSAAWAYVAKQLGTPLSTVYLRTYLMVDSEPSATFNFLTFRSNANGTIAILQYNGAAHKWSARCCINGSWNEYTQSGTTQIVPNKWFFIEFAMVMSATVGQANIWINDTQIVNQTNINTAARGNVDLFYVGPYNLSGAQAVAINTNYDDVVISDAKIGPINQTIAVTDSIDFSDSVLVSKLILITNSITLIDSVLRHKSLVVIIDNVSAKDNVLLSKFLIVTDNIAVSDEVDRIGRKTRIFLLLGSVAIQLYGD
jgi:hypothetical protein